MVRFHRVVLPPHLFSPIFLPLCRFLASRAVFRIRLSYSANFRPDKSCREANPLLPSQNLPRGFLNSRFYSTRSNDPELMYRGLRRRVTEKEEQRYRGSPRVAEETRKRRILTETEDGKVGFHETSRTFRARQVFGARGKPSSRRRLSSESSTSVIT